MTVKLELNPNSQRALEAAFGHDLSRAALEALAIEGYRSGRLARHEVQELLGLTDRWDAETWLKSHRAYPDLSIEDVVRDAETSRSTREAACSSSPTPRR